MKAQTETISKAQIQYIQCLRHRAGIDDDTYGLMKKSVGVASTTELDLPKFNELKRRIEQLKKNIGKRQNARPEAYKKVHSSAYKSGMHVAPPKDRAAMLSKIEAILTELQLPWSYVDGVAKHMFGVDLIRWCDPGQTYRVLQAMIIHQSRQAGKTKDLAFYVRELKSEGCQCGARKKPGFSLCWPCFRKLPEDMRKSLYRKIGKGYEQAYDRAVAYLTGDDAQEGELTWPE